MRGCTDMSHHHIPRQSGIWAWAILMCLFVLVVANGIDQHLKPNTTLDKTTLHQPYGWPTSRNDFRVVLRSEDYGTCFGFYEADNGLYELSIIWTSSTVSWRASNNIGHEYAYERVWRAKSTKGVNLFAYIYVGAKILELRDEVGFTVWAIQTDKDFTNATYELKLGKMRIKGVQNQTIWDSCDFPSDTLLPDCKLKKGSTLTANGEGQTPFKSSYTMMMTNGILKSRNHSRPYWSLSGAHGGVVGFFKIVLQHTYAQLFIYNNSGSYTSYERGYIMVNKEALVFLRLDCDGILRWYTLESNMVDSPFREWFRSPFDQPSGCNSIAWCPTPRVGGPSLLTKIGEFSGIGLIIGIVIGLLGSPIYRWLKILASSFSSLVRPPPLHPTAPSLALAPNLFSIQVEMVPLAASTPIPAMSSLPILSPYVIPPSPLHSGLDHPPSLDSIPSSLPIISLNHAPHPLAYPLTFSILQLLPNPSLISTPTLFHISSLHPTSSSLPIWPLSYHARLQIRVVCSLPTSFPLEALSLSHAPSLVLAPSPQIEDVVVVQESRMHLPIRFSIIDLEFATHNFFKVIGEGGFGKVYEGILSDGTRIAVKKLNGTSQGQTELEAEITAIGNIHHDHIVRLYGFCSESCDQLLVYELVAKGSLDRWIFGNSILDWTTRSQIVLDVANGLRYLHQDCEHKIIHFDIKPQNILLDDNFRAKIADFGMSRRYDKDVDEIKTHMRGTPGYLAPDWYNFPTISEKCDVYSFGMVLLEIVSGRKNTKGIEDIERWYFPAWLVRKLRENESCLDCIDVHLRDKLTVDSWHEANKVIKIGLWCIQDNPQLRPSMAQVVDMLEDIMNVDEPPLSFEFLELTKC